MNKFTKIALGCVALVSTVVFSASVLAQSTSPWPKHTPNSSHVANRLAELKAKGDLEITRRVDALNALIGRINQLKRISDADKSSLVGQVQAEITNLNNLKAKTDADTDLATLKADIQSIITRYRIFALFIPKIHIIVIADRLDDIADLLTQEATKLQTKIQTAQSEGKDVTKLQDALSNMQAKIADAKAKTKAARDEVMPLTPEGFPDNKDQLKDARKKLQDGRDSLKIARHDRRTILNGLNETSSPKNRRKSHRSPNPALNPSSSPVPSSTPEPTESSER